MMDWSLAVKIAVGGFGLVFLLLIFLGIAISATKAVLIRTIEKETIPKP